MTKDRIEKELARIKEQLDGLQSKRKDLEGQLKMVETAEMMKFIEKNRISLNKLMLLTKLSEDEVLKLLRQRDKEQESIKKEAFGHESKIEVDI